MVTGWRHIWSWRMYQIDPPIVECYIAGQWDVSKERKMTLTLENHSYIRQLFQELMKHSQASVGHTRWLFFINQGLTNSVHSVLQLCQFILVYAKKFKSLSIYVCLFPHCILLFLNWVSLVLLVFFFTTNPNNCFVLWSVFHDRDRKIHYATLHEITHDRYFT